ncbi:MAG TPA: HAMP domain-containing sensor histidine kinase [Gemmatimonadales bacterium]|nr:HAMP domain-containing sensor histidine kinase [Gemmatimonadales bacterium]
MESTIAFAPRVYAPEVPVSLWQVVDRAQAQVETGWQQVAEHSPSREEVSHHLGLLRRANQATGDGAPVELPRSVLSRRLLALLRRAVLDEVRGMAPAPASGPLLQLLGAFEQVEVALEPDWAQHFADRLSGPDGMELVVEVAHDLRSPLTSILFLAETLQRARSGPINAVQERQLGLIYSAAFGLSSLASDVIELARGGDRLVDIDPLPFSIADIFESVRDIVQPIAEEKGLQVRIDMGVADFRVGYPVALSRVLLNLTTNALKFTSEGYVDLRAEAGEGNEVVFSVRDTGRGIPPQALLTLFEPFRRRQKQGEYAFSGAGLGLSICRKLVEAMRSSLKVETREDGTRFYFTLDLPLARERI